MRGGGGGSRRGFGGGGGFWEGRWGVHMPPPPLGLALVNHRLHLSLPSL